jgi:hypothetical protein
MADVAPDEMELYSATSSGLTSVASTQSAAFYDPEAGYFDEYDDNDYMVSPWT